MTHYIEPTLTASTDAIGGAEYQHDAFGTITMSVASGTKESLFGSDLEHHQTVRIEISRAKLRRTLNHDWISATNAPIVVFEMSHAQFSRFITSSGNGSGTPVTLCKAPAREVAAIVMPGIKPLESKQDTLRREIVEASRKRLESIQAEVAKLGDILNSGKIGKRELTALHESLARHVDNLPGSMEFVVRSAEEALAQATHEAKSEIEAFAAHTLQQTGLQALQHTDNHKLTKLQEGKSE